MLDEVQAVPTSLARQLTAMPHLHALLKTAVKTCVQPAGGEPVRAQSTRGRDREPSLDTIGCMMGCYAGSQPG